MSNSLYLVPPTVGSVGAVLAGRSRFFDALRGRSVFGDFLGAGGFAIAGRGLNLLSTILLTNQLGSEFYGIYALGLTLLTLLCIPANLGIPEFIARELPRERDENLRGFAAGLRRRIHLFQGLITFLTVTAFFLALAAGNGGSMKETLADPLVVLVIAVPLLAMLALEEGFLRGSSRVRAAAQIKEFVPALVLASVLLVVPVKDPMLALTIYAISIAAACLVGAFYLRAKSPTEEPMADHWRSGPGTLYRRALPFALITSVFYLNQRTDILMLGALGEPEDVGRYQVAAQFALLTVFPQQIMNRVLGPRIARLIRSEEYKLLPNLLRQSTLASFTGIMGIGLCWLLLTYFSTAIFGDDFTGLASVFLILGIGNAFNLLAGPAGTFLNQAGLERLTLYTMVFSAVLNICFNFFLIPLYGMHGAAMATLAAQITWNSILVYLLYKKMGLRPGFTYFIK